jgi:hypothetical protein
MRFTIYLLSMLLASAIFYSCNRVEGCTDPIAENFDAEADKDCCCSYYQLSLRVNHLADTLSFNYFSPFPDVNNDSFEIQRAAFLCSNFELIKADGSVFRVRDSIGVETPNGSQFTLIDDFSCLRPATFVNNIGDFLSYGDYEKLRFLVGLDFPASDVDATIIDDRDQPLSNQYSPNFFNGIRYNNAFFEVILPSTEDTVRYEVQDTFWIELNYNVSAADGQDTEIPIAIDYLSIFDGISFANDDSTTVVQKIKNNITHAFSIQ